MKSAIELHDSWLVEFDLGSDGSAKLTFDAYVHRTEGEPARSPWEGGQQRVCIVLKSTATSGEVGSLPADIYDGELKVGGNKLDLVPLPFSSVENCELRLTLREDGREFTISGKNISVESEGSFHFIEHVNR